MLFEISLSQSALAKIFARRFSQLERICLPLPPPDTGLYFNRVDLKGPPTFTGLTFPHAIHLADASQRLMDGKQLRITQPINVFLASLSPDVVSLGPVGGSLDFRLGLEKKDGNLQLYMYFEYLNLDVNIDTIKEQIGLIRQMAAATPITYIPVPIGDILNQLTERLPSGGSIFKSTDVLNFGLTLGQGSSPALIIRIEVDAIDSDAEQVWTNFFAGDDSPVSAVAGEQDWTFTVDRRIFQRIVSSMLNGIEAKSPHDGEPGTLDLTAPSYSWHTSQDLVGFQLTNGLFSPPKIVATGLPTLSASVDGTAVDVCGGVGGSVNIDFTAHLTLAFTVRSQDIFRFYAGVNVDASDWDLFRCGVNLAATFTGPMVGAMGVFGIAVAIFLAAVVVSMAGDSVEIPSQGENCHNEYQFEVCDVPWFAWTSLGVLHLTSLTGIKRGLVLLGPIDTLPTVPSKLASWQLADEFSWYPISCAPIESVSEVQAEALGFVGATICDAQILNDEPGAYVIDYAHTIGSSYVKVICRNTPPNVPTYPCRVLLATTRGLVLGVISPPPAEVSLEAVKARQQLMCMQFPSEFKKFHRWPDEMIELIRPELRLLVINATIAGLEAGRIVQLQVDGKLIASNMPGRLGFASVSAALGPELAGAEFSVELTGKPRAAPITRSALAANLEFWRHAGTVAAFGTIQDVSELDSGQFWLATMSGLLRIDLQNDAPVLSAHTPLSGIHQLAVTEYGVLVGGENGLALVDGTTGQVQERYDIGPIQMMARRGSVLYVAGNRTLRAFQLGWKQDARGRRQIVAVEQISMKAIGDIRSGLLAGRFLVLESEDSLEVYQLQGDGGLARVGALPMRGLRGIQRAVGSDSREALVAALDERAVLIRLDAMADSRDRRPETLDLPGLPWFLGSRRTGNWLVRTNPKESVVDVFQLIRRVDLMRWEAQAHS